MKPLYVYTDSLDFLDDAQAVAERLNMPLSKVSSDFMLELTEDGLQLVQDKSIIKVDFAAGKSNHRRLFGGGRKQMLARACGFKPGVTPSILDATAGLGRDAFVLASLGADVTMLERNPIVAALLEDGLSRAKASENLSEILSRMHFQNIDAKAFMQVNPKSFDTVYLDPMFPERRKSAQVKKEMQCLQQLVNDLDADELLQSAKACARNRIVVKRPAHAETLAGKSPDFSLKGKSSRWDVYVC